MRRLSNEPAIRNTKTHRSRKPTMPPKVLRRAAYTADVTSLAMLRLCQPLKRSGMVLLTFPLVMESWSEVTILWVPAHYSHNSLGRPSTKLASTRATNGAAKVVAGLHEMPILRPGRCALIFSLVPPCLLRSKQIIWSLHGRHVATSRSLCLARNRRPAEHELEHQHCTRELQETGQYRSITML